MADYEHEESQEQPERLFELSEAEELLPQLHSLLTGAREKKQRTDTIEREFSQVRNRILVYGGIVPPYAYLAELKAERDGGLNAIRQALAEIEQTGCVVKDLDQGLVDFPAMVNDEQVYLCWKLGEKCIGFWHRMDEGFAGRKPLDSSTQGPDRGRKPN